MGQKHLFVRFRACNIACEFCDEFDKVDFRDMTVQDIIESLRALDRESGPHEYVSLTGGEPLLYVAFLKHLLPSLRQNGFRTYLETNGTLPRALRELLNECDMIAMDIKLPSVTKEPSFFGEHEEFLEIAAARPLFVKMVISKSVLMSEFLSAVRLIARVNRDIPLILQPKTDVKDGTLEPQIGEFLSSLVSLARRDLTSVRAIPQTHKWMSVR